MPTTQKVPVSETRSAEENEAKKSRGDFIHGANWALKFIRENSNKDRFGFMACPVFPHHEQIARAAQERFPFSTKRRRVVRLGYTGGRTEVYLRLAPEGQPQAIQFFEDAACTRQLVSSTVQLTASVVKAMADLMDNPDEEVAL